VYFTHIRSSKLKIILKLLVQNSIFFVESKLPKTFSTLELGNKHACCKAWAIHSEIRRADFAANSAVIENVPI